MRSVFLVTLFSFILVTSLSCSKPEATRPPATASATASPKEYKRPAPPYKAAAVAHAGVMTTPEKSDGCRKAVEAALAVLEGGGSPLDAAVAGVVILEDDPRFNAGTGSLVRLDGKTIQMDASVMDSVGHFGSVANVENVKNPVRVARAIVKTPHRMLAGEGATAFARALGLPEYNPTTEARAEQAKVLRQKLIDKDPELPKAWQTFDWKAAWNFEPTLKEAGVDQASIGSDTVGVVVRSTDGRFASALSTGGWTIALRGRVGDVPIRGAGLFASQFGAAAATGTGERIMDELAAFTTVWQMAQGTSAKRSAQRIVDRIKGTGSIGMIAIGPKEITATADRPMAWAGKESGSTKWYGPSSL